MTSNYTDLKKCHKVREKSFLFTENVQNRCLLSAHAVNWYYQNSLFSCVLPVLTASPIRLTCCNPANQLEEGQYKTVVSQGISIFLMTFHIEQQRHSHSIQYWKAKYWSIFSTTTDAKGSAMLPAQSLRFRETGGRFVWGECQLYHRKVSNSYCRLFCFNSNCNRLLSQIKTPIFQFLSTQKLENINDLLSISLLIGSIADRLEINSTDLVVSYHFVLLNDR